MYQQIKKVAWREIKRMLSRPIYLFSSVFVMLFCSIFFLTFIQEGLPQDLPMAIVDSDNSYVSRALARALDASPQLRITEQYASFADARKEMQKGNVYAIVDIPEDFESQLLSSRQPTLNFYVNDAYLIAGSLAYKDLTYISEMGTAYLQKKSLEAKGVIGDNTLLPILRPIATDKHQIGNPYTNYGIYLLNVLLFGIFQLLIVMLTIFAIGVEMKENTAQEWLASANGRLIVALLGKLLPYTLLFTLLGIGGNLILYKYMHFTLNGSFLIMSLIVSVFVLAYQAIGTLFIGILPRLRDAISLGAFYSVWGISFAGFTFPIEAMPFNIRIFANLFPIRHYFLLYTNGALYNAPQIYSLPIFLALLSFLLLPLLVYGRIRKTIKNTPTTLNSK